MVAAFPLATAPPVTPTYSLIVPTYDEEAVIPILLRRLDALLDSARCAGRSDFRRRRLERRQRDRARGQGARRPALSAVEALAQFRPSDRYHDGHGSRRRPGGHRDGRRPARPAGSRPRHDRQMEGRLRGRLRAEDLARGRERLQAPDRRSVLPPDGSRRRNRNSARRRRFPSGRPQGAGLLSGDARARPFRARHVRLDRLPPDGGDVRPAPARRRRNQIFLAQNGPPGGERAGVVFGRAASPRALGRGRDLGSGARSTASSSSLNGRSAIRTSCADGVRPSSSSPFSAARTC